MRRLHVDMNKPPKPPDMRILERYEVHPHAYGYCPKCNTLFDYWKYGETDFMCPYRCGGQLRELTPMELAEVLAGCEEDGCFEEEFAYAVPLRPTPKASRATSRP
jgi:hypothetical protein